MNESEQRAPRAAPLSSSRRWATSVRPAARVCASALFASGLLLAPRAHALQPLSVFLAGATNNPANREARATSMQRDADESTATGHLLPQLSAGATYTRNQYEVAFDFPLTPGGPPEHLIIQPLNQYDANVALSVPLIDVGAWQRRSAAKASLEAQKQSERATVLDTERQVAEAYFQLVGNAALLESATRSLTVAQQNADTVRDREHSGTASELDMQRAVADVARAEQDVASAGLGVTTSARNLATLSGLEPEPSTAFPVDDLHAEPPLATWLRDSASTPTVTSAVAARRAAEKSADASRAAWLPTVTGTATERFTNATAFAGHAQYYLLQATASWKLDATLSPSVRAQNAAAAAAIAREDGARRRADDAIFQAWNQISSDLAKARAARAQVTAAALAQDLARDRYAAGVATQLDVLQAESDLFKAEVARIQADSDLGYARVSLRLYAGRQLTPGPETAR
ncbi:MAG TPA: TolC family protein [Polyangiaceae bacterium]|nr:TolC family protein [Polyangiaceae bacterium]